MQNRTLRCIFKRTALEKENAVVQNTLHTSTDKAAKQCLGKQDTTVFPLPYFWSTNFHRSHQQNLSHEGAKARSWGDKQCLLHSKRLLQSFYRRQFNPVQSNVVVSSKHLLHLKINCNRLEIRKKLNTLLPKWGIHHPSGCSGELLLEKKNIYSKSESIPKIFFYICFK